MCQIIMPIQRAARYKLLFKGQRRHNPRRSCISLPKTEMMAITAGSASVHEPIGNALLSAERLAEECDRRQVFDLHAIRRQITSPQQAKKSKKQPRSLGGVHNTHVKEKHWTNMRAVTTSEA